MSIPIISLALTHYNRFPLLTEAIAPVLDDPRLGEIVIVDDNSTDDSWPKLLARYGVHSKVRLYRNFSNLDCYANKARAVQHCQLPWVILLDSDNIIQPDYLDTLYQLSSLWDENTIYCPEFAKPYFDYRAFRGLTIDRHNVASLMGRPNFACLLNTANYFIPRLHYLQTWDPSLNPHTADSLYMAYRWLASGRRLQVLQNLTYFHRIHDGSHYKQNVQKTGTLAKEIEAKLRKLF